MKKNLILMFLFVSLALFAGCAQQDEEQAEGGPEETKMSGKVEVKGSTTVLPIMQKASEAYMQAHPGVNISISGGGSSNGAKALIDGTCDIAMMSRDMKEKEQKAAEENGRTPVQHVIAFDCIVPVVHPTNPVDNLTIEQLQAIYAGEVTNWKDVGGPDKEIVVISRDTSSGTYEVWAKKVMEAGSEEKRVFAGALLQASNGAVAQAVAKNEQAIGYVGLGYVNEELKSVTVDGVAATVETAQDGSYPISRGLNLYTPGEPAGHAKGLIDFIMSPEGQKMVAEIDFVPVN